VRRFWAQPLRRQLFIAILLLLVPVVGTAVWSAFVTIDEHTQELSDRTRAIATATSIYVSRDLPQLGGPLTGETAARALELADRGLYSRLTLPEGAVVTIASPDGALLASIPPGAAVGGGDREWVYAEAQVDGAPWVIRAGLPTSLARERATSLWMRSSTVLVLGLLGWLVVVLVLSRRFTGAVSHLHTTAQRIAEGDFSPLQQKPMVSREFADLQEAFDAMLKRFNETRRTLDAQMAEERGIRTELQSLQGQVIRQERLAAVGQLVSGVAHEINNPLQAILGFAELLQVEPDVPESVKDDLRLIQKESARACGIIRNLALFARQQTDAAGPVRLVDVIGSVAELRQRRLESEDIELRVEDQSTQHVMAVAAELQQVVLNFVVNAEHAVIASGRLPGRITVRTYDRDAQVVLEVEDTGPGIEPAHESKLFQPFFTTKPVGQGTGLGLSVSYGIIESLGGQIGYRAAPAGGSIFYFVLPMVSAPE
jgi:C4-dicarboxylate-specific signal transduction histidine kinase